MIERLRRWVTVGAAASLVATAALVLTTASVAQAATCKEYLIIGVRGSGEVRNFEHEMGSRVGKAADAAARYLATMGRSTTADIDYYSVNYPAIDVSSWTVLSSLYFDSVSKGRTDLKAHISSTVSACPKEKLILIGYSQGAEVIHETLTGQAGALSAAETRAVMGVLLIADPDGDVTQYYNHMLVPNLGYDEGPATGSPHGGVLVHQAVPEPFSHRTIALCFDSGDGVCNFPNSFGNHGTYDTVIGPVDVLNVWGAAVMHFSAPAGQASSGAMNDFSDTTRMFMRGTDNMDHETYLTHTSTTWSGITGGVAPSGTTVASDPVSVVDHHNVIYVFVRGADTKLYVRTHTVAAGWSAWKSLGGSIVGRPRAVVDNDNIVRVYVHGVGAAGHIDEIYLLNGHTTWSAYVDTGLVPLGDAVPVVDYDGTVRVYAIDSNHNLVERYLANALPWSEWNTLLGGGFEIGSPTPIVDARNVVRVYVHDTLHLWEVSLTPGHTWSVYSISDQPNGFILATGWEPVAYADHWGIVRVYAVSGSQLWERYLIPGHIWSNWGSLGGTIRNPVSVTQNESNQLYVFVHNSNNSLGQDQLNPGAAWSGIVSRTGVTLAA